MKHLAGLALAVVVVTTPLYAQRGGGGGAAHGGFSGGHSAPAVRSAPAFRAAPAPVAQSHFSGGAVARGNRPPGFAPIGQRPSFYNNHRPGYPGPDRYRRYPRYYGIGIPYGIPVNGWIDSDYPGDFDSTGYDPSGGQPDDSANANVEGYAQQAADQGPPPPYQEQPPAEQPPAEPQAAPAPPAAPLENEDAVTLIFKDGRPSEQIHNYALTRTTLYIRDQHRRDIPVDQIDLAATQKVNHDAGIDFHVPSAAQ